MSSEWSCVEVASICEAIYDGPHATPKKTLEGPIFLGISSLNQGRLDLSSVEHLSEEDFIKWTKRVTPKEGDLVFSYETRLGEVAMIPAAFHGCLGRRMALMRIDRKKALPEYVLYAYLSPTFQEIIRARTVHGSTVDRIPLTEFGSFPIHVPPLDVQRGIAETLKTIDDRIALLRETNATLEAIAQALFKSWFVDFDPVRAKMEGRVPEGMDEATAALFPDSFEELEWGAVPRGWRVGAFSDVCDIASGKRPPDRSDSAEVGNETPLYGGAGIMGYTSMPLFDDRKILTGRVGTLGKVHIAYPPFWASDNVLVITPKDQSCFSLVLHWLRTIDVLALNRGSTQPLLTQRDLGAQRGVIPPSHVVAEFEEVVEPLYQRIQEQEVQVQTLASLRDNLLPRLISGQLSLLDAESTISEAQV